MPIIANFTLARLEDGVLTIGLEPPAAIGGWNLQLTCMKRFGGQTPLFLKSCASGFNGVSGITVVNSGQGIFNIPINSVDTSGSEYGNYATFIERLDSGFRTVIDEGYLTVNP
jgi:hypothetical protein